MRYAALIGLALIAALAVATTRPWPETKVAPAMPITTSPAEPIDYFSTTEEVAGIRNTVVIETSTDSISPHVTSTSGEIALLKDMLTEAEKEIAALREQLHICERYGPETPFGEFIRSTAAANLVGAEGARMKRWMELILDQYPIHLRPGETEWFLERAPEWSAGGINYHLEVIEFFGRRRLLEELPKTAFITLEREMNDVDYAYLMTGAVTRNQ